MLGRLKMSVDECIAAYTKLNKLMVTVFDDGFGRINSQKLKDALLDLLAQKGVGQLVPFKTRNSWACRTLALLIDLFT